MTTEERLDKIEAQLRGEEPVEALYIFGTDEKVRLVVQQGGNRTATLIRNESDNPPLRLVSMGNAAGLEVEQADEEDAVTSPSADARFRQLIGLNLALNARATVQLEKDVGANDYDVIIDFPDGDVRIGNEVVDKRIRFSTGEKDVRFECGGVLIMSVNKNGVKVHKWAK